MLVMWAWAHGRQDQRAAGTRLETGLAGSLRPEKSEAVRSVNGHAKRKPKPASVPAAIAVSSSQAFGWRGVLGEVR